MSLLDRMRDLFARQPDDRVELAELAACMAGDLAGVDLTSNPAPSLEYVPEVAPAVTPRERLDRAVFVSRDFRAAGAGGKWDRVRTYPSKPYGYPRDKSRGQSRGVRKLADVDTIVLHTAAVDLGPDRWLGVPCHGAIASDASVVLCHHPAAYLWAAHALNRRSVSVEISGNRKIALEQVEPARALVRYYVELLREHGEPDRSLFVVPHRHGHSSRAVDCDVEIWRAVGEWAIDTLGLALGPVVGSGRPVPREWWTPGRRESQP